ncbi:hypothetical protein LGM71_23245 [Burkholderia sp. AU33545]|uniref:hypothetical protein n=1 Tax=Burkholderia sp. AU33545 TaxID=2879631 RepID=UPI001CF2421D|nr:hypothetical protein [Burkholderia sp. AU33545]MCA8203970.1 hypothetical protein [Burkholderia sp. AU33545]
MPLHLFVDTEFTDFLDCDLISIAEVMELIEATQFYGRGRGISDLTLLASTLMTPGASIWTPDRRLSQLAGELGVAYIHDIH